MTGKSKKKKKPIKYLTSEEAEIALAMAEGFRNFESTIYGIGNNGTR